MWIASFVYVFVADLSTCQSLFTRPLLPLHFYSFLSFSLPLISFYLFSLCVSVSPSFSHTHTYSLCIFISISRSLSLSLFFSLSLYPSLLSLSHLSLLHSLLFLLLSLSLVPNLYFYQNSPSPPPPRRQKPFGIECKWERSRAFGRDVSLAR